MSFYYQIPTVNINVGSLLYFLSVSVLLRVGVSLFQLRLYKIVCGSVLQPNITESDAVSLVIINGDRLLRDEDSKLHDAHRVG